MSKYHIDQISDTTKFRILCAEDVSIYDFKLLKPMPKELTQRLQDMVDYFEKHELLYEFETVELIIQYLTDSDIKIKNIHGIYTSISS